MIRKIILSSIWLAITICLFALFLSLVRNPISDKDLFKVRDTIEIGDTKNEVEKIVKKLAPYSEKEEFDIDSGTLIFYRYHDEWPLSEVPFTKRYIKVEYDKEGYVVSVFVQRD